jgi:hypothetical protein
VWNSDFKMTTNTWYHVAITYDGETVQFYLNGAPDSNPPVATLQFGVVSEPLTLGVDLPGGDEYFSGTIRDARVYGRALGSAEILALVNRPPSFSGTPLNYTPMAGVNLLVPNPATDPDVPAQTLGWSLLASPPGADINPSNGIFSWRPTIDQSPSINLIKVKVLDNGTPALSATQSFTVTVLRPQAPGLDNVTASNGLFSMWISGEVGPDYVVEAGTNLADGSNWLPVSTNLSPSPPFFWTDPIATSLLQRFYRVRLAP